MSANIRHTAPSRVKNKELASLNGFVPALNTRPRPATRTERQNKLDVDGYTYDRVQCSSCGKMYHKELINLMKLHLPRCDGRLWQEVNQ